VITDIYTNYTYNADNSIATTVLSLSEPPRENWRLHSLRGWSDEQTRQVSG